MIEVTTREVDGILFIRDMKILEPDGTYGGVPYHIVQRRNADEECLRFIKAAGLRKAGRLDVQDADMYTEGNISYWRIKTAGFLFRIYWSVVKWLYDNGRIFKQITPGSRFSWSYFTPYCWLSTLKRKH